MTRNATPRAWRCAAPCSATTTSIVQSSGPPDFTAPFQDLITRYAWGEVWSRPGLDPASRSMITLALLTALGQEHELATHVSAALRNGLSTEQIREVLLHSAVYAGIPAANRAFAVAQRVFDDAGPAAGSEPSESVPPGVK